MEIKKMDLKRFRKLKNELLKEWTENDHDNKQIFYLIKHNFYNNLKFTAGSRPRFGHIGQFETAEELENLFGFPYTSSSGFGALWVTNTQAEANTKQFYLKFRAIAKDTQNNYIFIFEDKKEQFYYFNANIFEFSVLMNEAQKIDQSQTAEQFTKEANKIFNVTIEVLKKYEGKPYGEATRQKIRDAIKEGAKDTQIINKNGCGASFWLDCDRYGQGLKVSSGSKYNEFYYFKFLNNSNKIEIDEIPAPKKEYNGARLHAQADKLRQKIAKMAGDLLPLVEEFNDIERTLYNETNDTDIHSFKLHSVAKYGIKN